MMLYDLTKEMGYMNSIIWYSIFIIAAAIVFGWLYYVSYWNLWFPVLIHGFLNAFGWLFAYDDINNYGGPTMIISIIIIWFIAAIIITLIYRLKKLKRTQLE